MLYIVPTKRGMGVELWGTYDDLNFLYDVISKFWNDEQYFGKRGFESRDKIISGFSYEIRKAIENSRLSRKSSHYSFEEAEYLGAKLSWVHFLFSLSALRFNMRFYETSKLDISLMLQLEFWVEKAMRGFDESGANQMTGFIDGGLYEANDYLYNYMRSINIDFFALGGGKKGFRKLSKLLNRGVIYSDEYHEYLGFLKEESKRLNCEISEMEIDDEHIDYEKIKW